MSLNVSKRDSRLSEIFLAGWRPYAWIGAAIAILYFRALWFGFTYLDDNALILDNAHFLSDIGNISQAFFQKVFPKSFLPYYRPALTISFMLDAQLAGQGPLVYHLTNIIIHILASSLVFVFFIKLNYSRLQAFAAVLIFAVHPVLSQAVAWVPGRNDSLLAVFVLASFIFFLNFLKDRNPGYYILHIFFFALGLYTKESAFVLMAMCFLYLHFIAGEKLFSSNEVTLILGWGACTAVWIWSRNIAVIGARDITAFDVGSLVILYMPAAIHFVGKIFMPFNLSVFPIMADTSFAYGIFSLALMTILIVFTKRRRYNYLIFGLGWAILFMLPSLIRANYRLSADFLEHRVYVPIIGFFIVLFETDASRALTRNVRVLLSWLVPVVVIFSLITFSHCGNFKDRLSFWENAVRTSPHSSFAHLAMAVTYHDNGHIDKAFTEYKKCLELDPFQPGALYGLGEVYFKKGMLKEAEAELKKTIAVHPFYDNAYLELGVICYKHGKPEEAERLWIKALTINPKNINTNKLLAILYYEQKDFKKCRQYVKQLQGMGVTPPQDFLKALGAE